MPMIDADNFVVFSADAHCVKLRFDQRRTKNDSTEPQPKPQLSLSAVSAESFAVLQVQIAEQLLKDLAAAFEQGMWHAIETD